MSFSPTTARCRNSFSPGPLLGLGTTVQLPGQTTVAVGSAGRGAVLNSPGGRARATTGDVAACIPTKPTVRNTALIARPSVNSVIVRRIGLYSSPVRCATPMTLFDQQRDMQWESSNKKSGQPTGHNEALPRLWDPGS